MNDHEYAGFVGVTPAGFEAQDARGKNLGRHSTRELASQAVTASVTRIEPGLIPPHTSAPHISARHPRPLRRPE